MKLCWDNINKLTYNKKTGKWYKGKIPYIYKEECKVCKEPYFAKYYSDSKFCSLNCASKFNNSGKRNSNYGKKGEKNPFYGKHHTEETIQKLRESKTGTKNHNWKGGVTKKNLPLYNTYAPQLEWCEEIRRNKNDPNILEVKCAHCRKWFIPTRYNVRNRIYKLNKVIRGENRFYCSNICKSVCSLYGKQSKTLMKEDAVRAGRLGWLDLNREVQIELKQIVLARDDYKCTKCGSTEHLHCHHILPVAIEPLLSADIDNCITLCYNCHKEVHSIDGCKYGQIRMEIC
jgi:hypothetical protein